MEVVPSGLVHLPKEKGCEGAQPARQDVAGKGWEGGSPVVLRIGAREGDAAHRIMATEEKPVRRWEG